MESATNDRIHSDEVLAMELILSLVFPNLMIFFKFCLVNERKPGALVPLIHDLIASTGSAVMSFDEPPDFNR